MPEHNPYLKAAVLEVVDNQLRDNDPPETRKTYERLLAQGISQSEAKRLLGCAVVGEIFDMMKKHLPFNLARFTATLDHLPEWPEEGET